MLIPLIVLRSFFAPASFRDNWFFRAGRIRPHNANLTFGDLRIYFEAQPACEVDVRTLGASILLLDFGRTHTAVDAETNRRQG